MKNIENSDNTVLPTLEQLQQRFDEVTRFGDPSKHENVWFKADDVARVFGFSNLSTYLLKTLHLFDKIDMNLDKIENVYDWTSFGQQYKPFF